MNRKGPKICPGETKCKDFRRAGGKSREEKEKEACTGCRMFPTKSKTLDVSARNGKKTKLQSLVASVDGIRKERRSNPYFDVRMLTGAQYQALSCYDDLLEFYERRAEVMQRLVLEDAMTLIANMLPTR